MLIKVGVEARFHRENTPMLLISRWMSDNVLKKSQNMPWWKGTKVIVDAQEFHVDTLEERFHREEHARVSHFWLDS